MKSEFTETQEEGKIVLFVLIPHCKHCRETIEREILQSGLWERAEIGYPSRDGSPVALVYRKGKYPSVDYWEQAKRIKARLEELGYRVM